MKITNYIILLLTVCLFSSCSDDKLGFWSDESAGNNIQIGGIDTDGMIVSEVTTRAVTGIDAEKVDWLVQPLEQGLDITYGLSNATPDHKDVAILKLTDKTTNPATYTFRYKNDRSAEPEIDNENNAIWYNNGYHFFQGVYVPERIRYTSDASEVIGNETVTGKARDLSVDQHNANATGSDSELGNYTLLSHYLGMPATFRLTATIERIKLPFRHRLARVVAFVLIDPVLNTTLKGYKKDAEGNATAEEDPNTTSFRFCNVKVLNGVKAATVNGNNTLTPTWDDARKIIPHFDGEKGSYSYKTLESFDNDFKFYYKEEANGTTKELYPTSAGWTAVHNATPDANGLHNGYTEINYGKVPVYDVIVRPTYTSEDNVMYDEDLGSKSKKAFATDNSNKIDFEIELENKLRYTKRFEFDLDANYQTVVYLRISREHVDYNDAGSDLWLETKTYDDWYGVDNENGNRLSLAGSSWQRAYTYGYEVGERKPGQTHNSSSDDPHVEGVTDGKFYNASSTPEENEHAQYFSSTYKDMWVERFLQAHQGGAHHGDYFVLCDNINIDARLIPENFVFTGHLDGQDHTITLTNCGEPVYKDAENITQQLYTKYGSVYTQWSIPTLYVKHVTPTVYYQESELTKVGDKTYVTSTLTYHPAVKYTQAEADEENAKHLVKDSNEVEPGQSGYINTYADGYTLKTIDDVKTGAYYEVNASSVEAEAGVTVKTAEVITYPVATASTSPAYPITLDDLRTSEYYRDQYGTRFECPVLYQFAYTSANYLFAGLDGTYTTAQETAPNPYDPSVVWEANVHKETNGFGTHWVPTSGYRAEVLHTKVASPSILFKADPSTYTGNVQNCWNGATPVDNNTPAIPQYK